MATDDADRWDDEASVSFELPQVEGVTGLEWSRWCPVTVEGLVVLEPDALKPLVLASAIGKAMTPEGDFKKLGRGTRPLLVEIRPPKRDAVLRLMGHDLNTRKGRESARRAWRRWAEKWEACGMAHRCPELPRGSVSIFLQPVEKECPHPRCKADIRRPQERTPHVRSPDAARPHFPHESGTVARDEQGVARVVFLEELREWKAFVLGERDEIARREIESAELILGESVLRNSDLIEEGAA